jgi:hypothetical protein
MPEPPMPESGGDRARWLDRVCAVCGAFVEGKRGQGCGATGLAAPTG